MKFCRLIIVPLGIVSSLIPAGLAQSKGCPVGPPLNVPQCIVKQNSPYRPVDGTLKSRCSNLGKSFEPFTRYEKAHYDDCEWEMRKAVSQKELPTVRKVVNRVLRPFKRDLPPTTQRIPNFLITMMGQYIAHDISAKGDYVDANSTVECCANGNQRVVPVERRDPACCPIEIPEKDPDYPSNVGCLHLVRSKIVEDRSRRGYPAAQLNDATAFVDNSNLYGNEKSVTDSLRAGIGGQMFTNAENVMPERNGTFFLGDSRLNQTPQLQIWHSIYLREHNRIAQILQALNPHWSDQRVFDETRRIVIAQFQHVVYKEFLPAFISPSVMEVLDKTNFDLKKDAGTLNEFSHSIFRIFHGFIPTDILLISKNGSRTTHKLHKIIENKKLIRTQYDDIARGLLMQPLQFFSIDPDLLHGLFKENAKDPGLDLLSMDVMRGRDHGLPPYANLLKDLQRGSPVDDWKHLGPFMNPAHIQLLKNTYESVEDVDLMVGALLETPINGSLLGPTAQLMFYQQFRQLKLADPYFYTNPLSPNPFTKEQLKEISKASTNLLFCMNTGVEWVPKESGISPNHPEEVVSCDSVPRISYDSWRER